MPRSVPPATRKFADLITGTRFDDLPKRTVDATILAFSDWAGCAVAGSRTAVARKALRVVAEERAGGDALVFADGRRTSHHWAAFANGVASHSIELDDVHMGSIIHGGVVVAPAALAAAEACGADGRRLIEGLLVGFDVTYRVGEAIAPSHYARFHSTGTVGTLGAAAAAAKILGLSREQTLWALGNAASQAAALWQYLKMGDDTKVLHPGKAAMNGVLAASLARHGFNGADDAIEGERGFVATLADAVDWDAMLRDLGSRFKVEENGYKIHSCCRHGHVSIDQALKLAAEHDLRADDIRTIRVWLNKNSVLTIDDPNPPNAYKARFSIQYMMALSFLFRRVALEHFTEDGAFRDPRVRALMQRVEVAENPEFTKTYPRLWTAKVEVELNDGRRLASSADLPNGDPQVNVPVDQLDEKCETLMATAMEADAAAGLLRTLKGLADCRDARELFRALEAQATAV